MAKIEKGRLDGRDGMQRFRAAELYAMANACEARICDPKNTDDPKWLQRRTDSLRRLAEQKEKAVRKKIIAGKSESRVKARARSGL